MRGNYIVGAGAAGLGAAISTGWPVVEKETYPGGLCASYRKEGYLFEQGGGHWIFDSTPEVEEHLGPFKTYTRDAAVYFAKEKRYYPYPIQQELPPVPVPNARVRTMKDWLFARFGTYACERFFYPFNERYTAGLYDQIAPQDAYKSPVTNEGYNATFCYPAEGSLGDAFERVAAKCDVHYNTLFYPPLNEPQDGQKIISTVPLDAFRHGDPYTSVFIANIGAKPSKALPKHHWLYVPDSEIGFYRVGIYSNVDPRFAPKGRCSLYVERAHHRSTLWEDPNKYVEDVIAELQAWDFISDVNVADWNLVDCAYTWRWPGSIWREKLLHDLAERGIHSIGRYGGWHFQGIAASFREGLDKGKELA